MRSLLPPEERIVSREAVKGAVFGLSVVSAATLSLSALSTDFKALSPRFKLGVIAASGIACAYFAADSASRTLPLSPKSPVHVSPDPIYPGTLSGPEAHEAAREQQTYFGHARTDGSIPHSQLESLRSGTAYSNEDVKEAVIGAALGSAFGISLSYALNRYSSQFRSLTPMYKLGSIGALSVLVTYGSIYRYHQGIAASKSARKPTGTILEAPKK